MSVIHKQAPFTNVAANSTALLSALDMGETCNALVLVLGGTTFTKAQVSQIKVKLGGKVIADFTGTELDTMNKHMGRADDADKLSIHFDDPNARTINGESIGAIDTSLPYSGFSVEVTIGGATAPTLECWMVKSAPKKDPATKGMFRAYLKSEESFASAAKHNLTPAVGSDMGNLIARLHVFHTNLTHFEVKKNGLNLLEDIPVGVAQFLYDELNRASQSGHFCFDPVFDNNQSNAVSTVKPDGSLANMQFRGTFSDADTVEVISELYTTLERA